MFRYHLGRAKLRSRTLVRLPPPSDYLPQEGRDALPEAPLCPYRFSRPAFRIHSSQRAGQVVTGSSVFRRP